MSMNITTNNLLPEVKEKFLANLKELSIAFQTAFLTRTNRTYLQVNIEPTQENISVVRAIGQFGKKYTVLNLHFNKMLNHADSLIESANFDELKSFYTHDKQNILSILTKLGISESEYRRHIFLLVKSYDPSILDYLQKLEQELDIKVVSHNTKENVPVRPKNWELTQGKTPQINRANTIVYTFPNDWSKKYKYFKCLWDNYGLQASYKEVYEYDSQLKYPEKNIWKVNRNIRSTINKLRNEFEELDLPIDLETSKGFRLKIREQ